VAAPVSRIIGGSIVTLGVDPSINYQVGVVSSSRRCGGSIIGVRHVLTAAHCIIEQNGANSRLLQPVTDLRVIPGTSINGATSFRVSAVYVNPNFIISNNLENDVAVLRVILLLWTFGFLV
jgi:trypsin